LRVAVVVGTRPEIIKMSPVVHALDHAGVPFYVLHSGQHYDHVMDGAFFEALRLPPPRYNLQVGSGPHGEQTGKILEGAERVFRSEPTAMVLVQGDTNTVAAAALAAAKLHVPVGHVEAGLRSYDRRMPEEINRVVADHVADHLYAPTDRSRAILLGEGIAPDKVHVTGNTIADVVLRLQGEGALEPDALARFGVEPDGYVLVTAHRAENVDTAERLSTLLGSVAAVCAEHGLTALYPCHPRTRVRLEQFGLTVDPRVRLTDPVGLVDFLALERHARLILTDSGGVQEEACLLRVPCVTLRETTERPETVDVGGNVIAGLTTPEVVDAARRMLGRARDWANPFGDGTAGQRIAAHVASVVGR
jgi:UDP-N-acetylglucosamine 2-epimerase (non-hydrolysing)